MIGAGIGVLLFLIIAGIAWALISGDTKDDTIQVERIATEPKNNFKDVEPSTEDIEDIEEIEESRGS